MPRRAGRASWCCRSSRRRATASRTPTRRARSAEPVPGPATEAWAAVAAETGVVVVGGVCELDADGAVRNTAVVSGPTGAAGPLPQAPPVGPRDRAVHDRRRGAARRRHAGRAARHRRLLRPLVPRARARARPRRRGGPRVPEQPVALARPAGAAAPGRRDRPRDGAREPRARRGRRSLRHRARTPLARRRAGGRRRRHPPGHGRRTTIGRPSRSPRSTSQRPATSGGASGTTCSRTGAPGCTGRGSP